MIPGKSRGAGKFAEGSATLHESYYLVDGTRRDGARFGSKVTEVIFEGEDISPGTPNQINYFDLSGLEFRLSEQRLDLRRSIASDEPRDKFYPYVMRTQSFEE